VKTGCARLQVAPATLNCVFQPQRRLAVKGDGAGAQARTLDGEPARRLSTLHSDTQLNYQPRGLTVCQRKFEFLHLSEPDRGFCQYLALFT
jgi:hypothetical protein